MKAIRYIKYKEQRFKNWLKNQNIRAVRKIRQLKTLLQDNKNTKKSQQSLYMSLKTKK